MRATPARRRSAAWRRSRVALVDRRDGKPHYLRHLPRLRSYLDRLLVHPALAEIRDVYASEGLLREPAA